ncbi:ADP-ribosylglycohydrolase family protein [Streptomonospora sp. S1-112]|uniref:ADP-ribosylglycohydrolase family protein n=1 Tax=Streptomonospora mangrovi TaxID=2883123 RepID=A0A9X3NIB9_9ACTN|nr:ADP-ribosylglycohydrolase family protein [Streptomonospora mangrovi]MDA0564349.1 ADP-ribosylglycohydrolase family protein [Streptomonospora mangrovi]
MRGEDTGRAPGAAPEAWRDRARGALLGLACGDALGRPAENMTPAAIAERWGRLTELAVDERGTAAGTDDTEYSVFIGLLLAEHGRGLRPEHVVAAYERDVLTIEGPMRGAGFSELGTVQALRRGLAPPDTGRRHLHGWSDGLAMRAAPYGVFAAGDPAEAARLIELEGQVSHAGEGLLGGRAVAAGVAAAMAGAAPREVAAAAREQVPADSWTGRALAHAVRAADEAPDTAALGAALHAAVVPAHYPWTDLAPEAVALAFGAYLAAGGEVEEAVVTAANMGRDADTTAAIAGALAGAGRGASGIPRRWAAAIGPVTGSCLPSVAGRHVTEVADLLVAAGAADRAAEAERSGAGRRTPGG